MWQKSGNARFESAKRPRNQSTRADRVVGSPSTLGKFQKTTMLVTRAIAIVLVLQYFGIADASRILAVFPSNYKSHYTLGKVVFTELANRGHQLTLISQFSLGQTEQHENITEIKLDGVKEHFHELGLEQQEPYIAKGDQSIINEIINLIYGTSALVNYTLGYPKLQEIIKSEEQFDLLLIDMYFTDGLLGLAYYWKIPAVVLCSTSTNKYTNEMVGNPHNPAYMPSIFLGYTDTMSLKERLINSLASAFEKITYNYMYLPSQELTYKRYFGPLVSKGVELPPLIDLIHNVSLVLVNSHPALQYPRPSTPNMIHVGGMHILRDAPSKLPQHIDEYITAAPEGCILMSLGSLVKSSEMSIEHIQAFVQAFEGYKGRLRVIWKWENATLIDHPANVIIGPYLPQAMILAHPNVRLFITNGGSLSILEAVNANVPIIGIPIYGDQYFNVAQSEKNGLGVRLDFGNLTQESITAAIDEVLGQSSYKENAQRLGRLFHDNAIDPLENAIYHIEYILRTGGAPHLRSAAVDLSLWQQSLVDVSLIIAAGILLILAVPSIFICLVLRKSNSTVALSDKAKKTSATSPRRLAKKKAH